MSTKPMSATTTTTVMLLLTIPLLVVLLLLEVLLLLVEMVLLLLVMRLVVLPWSSLLHPLRAVRRALSRDEASATRDSRRGVAVLTRSTTGLLYAGRVVHPTCRRRRGLRQRGWTFATTAATSIVGATSRSSRDITTGTGRRAATACTQPGGRWSCRG